MSAEGVLVLDESLAVRSDLGDAFERRGYKVHSVRDADSARRAVARDQFRAAILGLDWNRIDVRSTRRDLLRDAGRNCPVVVLSEAENVETRLSVLREGATDFIAKPFNSGFVVKRVHESMHTARVPGGPYRILVVDDSPTYGHAVSSALTKDGHDVVLAASGREAEDYLAIQKPDAIFLDVFLPDADGIELARRLRSANATKSLPILLLTGRESTTVRARATEANVSDFAAKNTPLDDLRARVPSLILGRQAPARLDPRSGEGNPRSGEALFERVVAESGLSLVLGRSTILLALKRAGTDVSSLDRARLERAMPQIDQILTTFLPAAEARSRLSAIEALTRESDGAR